MHHNTKLHYVFICFMYVCYVNELFFYNAIESSETNWTPHVKPPSPNSLFAFIIITSFRSCCFLCVSQHKESIDWVSYITKEINEGSMGVISKHVQFTARCAFPLSLTSILLRSLRPMVLSAAESTAPSCIHLSTES